MRKSKIAVSRHEFSGSYRDWQSQKVSVGNIDFTICTKPGVSSFGEPDVAARLLAENLPVLPGNLVANLNCGSGLVAAAASALDEPGRIWAADSGLVNVEATRRTLEANSLQGVNVVQSHGLSHLGLANTLDVVAVRLPKGKLPSLQLILCGYRLLREGGTFLMAGANDEGINTYLRHVRELFGGMHVAAYKKGNRVGLATKPGDTNSLPDAFRDPILEPDAFHQFTVSVRGGDFSVCSRPSVFSWKELDEGTRALIETMELCSTDRILDLGCGTGVAGAVAATLAPNGTVWMTDMNIEAIASAAKTAESNGLRNCQTIPSDVTSGVRGSSFDVVIANPPFHLGKTTEYSIGPQFIRESAEVLTGAGRLFLVANRFLPYEDVAQERFRSVRRAYEDTRFKVLVASRPNSKSHTR